MRPKKPAPTAGPLEWIGDRLDRWTHEGIPTRPIVARLRTAAHFVYLVVHGFVDNRCPNRAAALSYTTLLALVPLLAVMFSFSKTFLEARSATVVPKLLDRMVGVVAPQLEYMPMPEDVAGPPAPGQAVVSSRARQEAVEKINAFVQNIDAGALGTVGSIFLFFVAIRLLMTIEQTFNDVWGVQRGRSIWRKIVYYWTTITMGPLVLVLAITLTGRAEFAIVFGKLKFAPGFEKLLLHLAPFAVVWIGFSLMYALMPNTHVRPKAAIAGGIVGGTLWQLNSLLSTLYLSRVVTYSKIYGALGIIPIFLVGLYFSWLIVLLGAQVSFAAQHLRTYLQQRASARIDQAGREALACRLVLAACQNFVGGRRPPNVEDLSDGLRAPLQLLNQVVGRLVEAGVLVEVADETGGLQPGRPPESLTVADVLHVMRTAPGNELPTRSATPDRIDTLLGDLAAAESAARSNARFSDLVDHPRPGAV